MDFEYLTSLSKLSASGYSAPKGVDKHFALRVFECFSKDYVRSKVEWYSCMQGLGLKGECVGYVGHFCG